MKGLLALLLSIVYVVYVVGQTCPTSNDFIIYNAGTPELRINATSGDVYLCGNQNLCTYLQNANTWTAQAGSPSGIYKTIAGSIFAQGTNGSSAGTAQPFDGLNPSTVTQAGSKFLFYGSKAAIRAALTDSSAAGSSSFSNGEIGVGSAAFGINPVASGATSTSFGYQNTASGLEATAFGYQTTASNSESTSFGESTTASGVLSTAFGRANTASGFGSLVFGYNATATNTSATAFGRSTRATASEATAFGLDANTANTTASSLLTPLTAGYPGAPDTTQITAYVGPLASGESSTAFGLSTYATALFSTAWGFGSYAEGIGSTAFGTQGQAEGYDSTTWGFRNYALGDYSTAFGLLTTAQGARSVSFGYETNAQFADSTAFGYGSVAQALESTAMGVNTYAPVYAELVVGTCNVSPPQVTNMQSSFIGNLTAFTVGIGEPQGYNCNNVSDAFAVFKNGDVVINRDIYFGFGGNPFEAGAGCGCISASGMCNYNCTAYGAKAKRGESAVSVSEVASLREEVEGLKREIADLKNLIRQRV